MDEQETDGACGYTDQMSGNPEDDGANFQQTQCGNAAQATHTAEQSATMEQASITQVSTSTPTAYEHQPADGKAPQTFNSDIASMRDALGNEAQQLIEDINAKRGQDTQHLAEFRKELENHVQKTCNQLEQAMFNIYEEESKTMQGKLQELFTVLDRVSQTEAELTQFKGALGALYRDMAQTE